MVPGPGGGRLSAVICDHLDNLRLMEMRLGDCAVGRDEPQMRQMNADDRGWYRGWGRWLSTVICDHLDNLRLTEMGLGDCVGARDEPQMEQMNADNRGWYQGWGDAG